MSSIQVAPPDETEKAPDIGAFKEHWQDESDASYLYAILARLEKDPKKAQVFQRLLRQYGSPPRPFRPSTRARLLAVIGRRFGVASLLSILLREEGREVKAYLVMHRETPRNTAGGSEALQLAKESAEHATTLAELSGTSQDGEPWHQISSGGFLRNVVYGFNDGLTANFGLVAGVLLGVSHTRRSGATSAMRISV